MRLGSPIIALTAGLTALVPAITQFYNEALRFIDKYASHVIERCANYKAAINNARLIV